MSDKIELTKAQELEIKQLRKEATTNYKMLNKVVAPELRIAHLERIIRAYNKIYKIQAPSFSDKIAFNSIKTNYKIMCAMRKIRPQADCV